MIEQLVLIILMVALIIIGERNKMGIYKVIAGFLSVYFALFLATDMFLTVIFIGLAIYLILSSFLSAKK